MSAPEDASPPQHGAPREPRDRDPSDPPKTLGEALLRLAGPLWNKWYGVPIILLGLMIVGIWQLLSEDEHRAVVTYVAARSEGLFAKRIDVVIDDLDTTKVNKSGGPYLWIFRPVAIQLQHAFEGTGHSTLVSAAGGKVRSKFTLKPLLTLNSANATVMLELHDAEGGLIGVSEITDRPEFFQEIQTSLGTALLHDLNFDRFTLVRTHPIRHQAKPAAFALFLEAQELESKNAAARPAAIQLIREAVLKDPDFAVGFSYLAALLRRDGKKAEADGNERHANELDPDHPKIDDPLRNPVPHLLEASEKIQWERLDPNVELKIIDDRDYDIHIVAWRIDPNGVVLKVAIESDSYGNSVREIRKRENAILAVNAGFFERDSDNHLNPVYALKVAGIVLNPYRGETIGGALEIADSGVRILTPHSVEAGWAGAKDLVYSKPLMIEPGGKFAMIYNDDDRRSRTAVCTTADGKFIVVVVNGGVSLFELAEFLGDRNGRQGLPCDAALALTGGPSTQASFSLGQRSIEIQGSWPVYDALVVAAR